MRGYQELRGEASGQARLLAVSEKKRSDEIGDLKRGRAARLDPARRSSMSERLARLHVLCKQLSAIKGAATAR